MPRTSRFENVVVGRIALQSSRSRRHSAEAPSDLLEALLLLCVAQALFGDAFPEPLVERRQPALHGRIVVVRERLQKGSPAL